MLEKLVLDEDLIKAKELYNCCYNCLSRALFELERNNIDETVRWIDDFQRCKRDLNVLIEKKRLNDKMTNLVMELKSKGIDIDIIKKSLQIAVNEKIENYMSRTV